MRRLASLAVLVSALSLTACSTGNKKDDIAAMADKPVELIYNQAADKMDAGEYKAAARFFNEVERQHPYSQWATKAQLMAAYALYKDDNFDEAVIALDRFIRLHPGHKDIDYAYYLKGLCYYDQITDVSRDQDMTSESLKSFDALLKLFPESTYARDARLKRDLTLDHLAGKEMEIGRYYLTRGYYAAAIKRFMIVMRDYQTTTHTPEALHRMVETYMRLGLKAEATRVAAVLGYNYPGSVWYEDSYALLDPAQRAQIKDNRGVVTRTIESLLKPE